MASDPDPEYVEARRDLLDVLEVLGPQRRAVVLVGAQAIYLRVGEGPFRVAPYTTDSDLAIDPELLADEPLLAEGLAAAGFVLTIRAGMWTRRDGQLDLMVADSLGGPGRRGARLGADGSDLARKTKGLEAAMVDRSPLEIRALDSEDRRSIAVDVAGIGALLVAKLHKLAEREAEPKRTSAKDALDVLRILQTAEVEELGAKLHALCVEPLSRRVTLEARDQLTRLFGGRDGFGTVMAIQATVGIEDPETIAASCEVLASELLRNWRV